jgi:hypothetical protein
MADDVIDFDATFGISSAKPTSKDGKPGKAGAAPAKEAIPTEDQSSSWTDHAYDLGSNLVHTGADAVNSARLLASDAGYGGVADTLGTVANKAYDYSDELAGKLSDKARKNNEAKALSLDEDGMAARPKGSQLIHGVNSSVGSMAFMGAGAIGGGIIGALAGPGGVAAGAYAGKVGASGFLELGSINRTVYDTLKKMSPEELASAPRYQELLQTTGDPTKALMKLADETGAAYQKGGAFVAGMLDGFGPVSSKISQLVTGAVKKGAKDGLIRAVGKEGLQEGAQSLTENLAKQGAVNQDFGTGIDPMDAAEDTAKGTVTGGALGAGAHMVPGGHGAQTPAHDRNPVNEDQNAALDQHGAEAISTDPNEPVTAAVDRVIEKAKQVAQPAAPVAQPPVTAGPVPPQGGVVQGPPQRQAIPLDPIENSAPQQGAYGAGGTQGQMAPSNQMYVQGQPVNAPYTPQQGPAPVNPMGHDGAQMYVGGKPVFGEQQGPQPRDNGTQPAQQELQVMPFLQAMADENNGTIDPRRIAAYLSSRGQTATWQEVMGELTPLVQSGVLQQGTIPGNQGQPIFRMSTERQGPQAPAQGPHLPGSGAGSAGRCRRVRPSRSARNPPVGPQQPHGPAGSGAPRSSRWATPRAPRRRKAPACSIRATCSATCPNRSPPPRRTPTPPPAIWLVRANSTCALPSSRVISRSRPVARRRTSAAPPRSRLPQLRS